MPQPILTDDDTFFSLRGKRMKLKRMPSMRSRKRYLIFRVHSGGPLDYPNVRDAVWDSMEKWLGQNELAQAEPRLIRNLWDGRQKKGFLQCSPRYVDHIKMALALIHQIGDQRVIFQVLRVSGTIKSGKEKTKTGDKQW